MRCGVGVTDTGRVNSTPLHAARRSARSLRVAAAAAGGLAAVAAAAVGTVAWCALPATGSDAINAARDHRDRTGDAAVGASELVGLLHQPSDLGPFADPAAARPRVAGSATPRPRRSLAQRRIEGRDAVILVLAPTRPAS